MEPFRSPSSLVAEPKAPDSGIRAWFTGLTGLFLLAAGACSTSAAELPFADDFLARGTLTGGTGSGTGSNVGATLEPDEPRHGSVPGGHSVWVAWVPPEDGVVTFSTDGSGFDTVLAVYAYERELKGAGSGPPDPTRPFQGLREVAREDDQSAGSTASAVEFGVRGGVSYAIAIDGFAGAEGAIALSWDLKPSKSLAPVVLTSDSDHALREGDTLTLSVEVTSTEEVEFEWYRDNDSIDGANASTLVIPNLTLADAGSYRVRIKVGDIRFFTSPVEIQLNTEGDSTALARDKLEHAVESPLEGREGGAQAQQRGLSPAARRSLRSAPRAISNLGVSRGFNGSQVFSTVYARRDPNEPLHCGVAGGASYWFAYQPPANGILRLDTDGSGFDTVLAVYAYNPPPAGFGGLSAVVCDNNSGANGLTSRVEFPADPARTYLVAVDGVNGARGTVRLNYLLTPTDPGSPPKILQQPAPATVRPGEPVHLTVVAAGEPAPTYQWRRDDVPVTGGTAADLILPAMSEDQAGLYSVVISNPAGEVVSQSVLVRIETPIVLQAFRAEGRLRLSFDGSRGWQYTLESTVSPGIEAWIPLTAVEGSGGRTTVTNVLPAGPVQVFRVRAD